MATVKGVLVANIRSPRIEAALRALAIANRTNAQIRFGYDI